MGVFRLSSFVKGRVGEGPKEGLPRGTRLLIDGSGWVHHLLSAATRFDLGGDYAALDAAVERAVEELRNAGFVLEVYRDGRDRQLKARTAAARSEQKREEWESLRQWSLEDDEDPPASAIAPSARFPTPPLAERQLYASLTRLEVSVIECLGEADAPLARAVATNLHTERASALAVVLADDSDFLLFRDCRYIAFNCCRRLARGASVPVWSRAALAGRLGLPSEARLVEMALLLGNDYTSHFSTAAWERVLADDSRAEHETLNSGAREKPAAVLRWLLEKPASWTLQDVDRDDDDDETRALRTAVRFSRAVYELEPTDDFPRDAESNEPSGAPFVHGDDDSAFATLIHAASAAHAVLAHCSAVGNAVTDEHQAAFELMFSRIKMKRGNPAAPQPPPRWSDVKVAYVFQRLARRALDALATKAIAPLDLFDGPLFHAALREVRLVGVTSSPGEKGGDAAERLAAVLPIDTHRDEILENVQRNRVTVLVGETGCGKSSRLPMMLMQQQLPHTRAPPKMMVSQPRRIAARALCAHVRKMPGCTGLVGLRMGHGEKDESPGTRVWFVTAGYLVRLLASNPRHFDSHSHLIIDEVRRTNTPFGAFQLTILCAGTRTLCRYRHLVPARAPARCDAFDDSRRAHVRDSLC